MAIQVIFGLDLSFLGRKRSASSTSEWQALKVALVSDELTETALVNECRVMVLTPWNYRFVLNRWKPDLVFVESAWNGWRGAWKYKIASYPDHPERTNQSLRRLVDFSKELGIPCVFWNKEDGVHFERFIDSASLFDFVFTVDENCISRYQARIGLRARVLSLMFSVQPSIHFPDSRGPIHKRSCFVGSYSHHIHDVRRAWQDLMFKAGSEFGLTVFDRNSSRKHARYRYPLLAGMQIRKSVSYKETASIYRDYMVSLNVNTVQDSNTMFSRRLVEILACGGLAVTNPAASVDRYFREFCDVIHDETECRAVFERLRNGLPPADRERALAGAEYVLREHTWSHRLAEVVEAVGI